MKKYLFVGERRSNTAIRMNVTWVDKRLAAAHLSKAVEGIGIDWNECAFKNVFEDEINDIKSFSGVIIAMGRKVEKELKKHGICHEFIYHPATRGAIRNIEKYKQHVKEKIGHLVSAIECDRIDTLGEIEMLRRSQYRILVKRIGIE
jgi:hypothetical protein